MTGVLFADIASLISSNFFTIVFAALFKLVKPPMSISFDFFPEKLDELKTNYFIIKNVHYTPQYIGSLYETIEL